MTEQRRQSTQERPAGPRQGRLLARAAPGHPSEASSVTPGLQPLGLEEGRDGLLYIPVGYSPERPAPLALMLHGAGGNAHHGLGFFLDHADTAGLILVSPESRRATWDVISGGYGPDVSYVDRALQLVFRRCAVDPAHVSVEGFSDGASYALSLGLTNGDLFTHVIAFSPGFAAPADQRGAPRVYVSHGVHDDVLPIDRCSRRLVPLLQQAGYDTTYHEFDGPHTVPTDIVREGLTWFLG
ncbi:MAG: Phospholipase/carboxylesterase [uncultured Chloroflexi bacterium]|uniref:Phospholipase/carboxylesterase n=1 Tax=uncultured Chloroflexota bacterium TaxID=166587 RepID=A0A6J4JHA4_9CHLR|nr:MAG: Phospholipase/carboxylesterase [uncultured Chloroflexota bacterium]